MIPARTAKIRSLALALVLLALLLAVHGFTAAAASPQPRTIQTVPEEWKIYLPQVWKIPPVENPGFEEGPSGWERVSTIGYPLIYQAPLVDPHGGDWAAWLGGDTLESASIAQMVRVPHDAPYLAYWTLVVSGEQYCSSYYDSEIIVVNGAAVHQTLLCSAANTGGWSMRVLDLSPYAGGRVPVAFAVLNDGYLPSSVLYDDFAFLPGPGGAPLVEQSPLALPEAVTCRLPGQTCVNDLR